MESISPIGKLNNAGISMNSAAEGFSGCASWTQPTPLIPPHAHYGCYLSKSALNQADGSLWRIFIPLLDYLNLS